jgi:hypothetical protein
VDDLASAWDFFDKVYCISLVARNDRRELAEKQFAHSHLLELVEFVIVDKLQSNPEQGIFASHLLCLNRGLAAGAQHILIFEDDVFFRNIDFPGLADACAELERMDNWDGLFLGCLTSGSSKTGTKSLVRIKYSCLAHAYALNQSFAERIVREKWRSIPYDTLLRKCSGDFFAVYPMCAFQGLAGTDNRTVRIDRLRRFFGGLPFIQRMNEMYQNHKTTVLAAHLAVLLGLVALACRLW